MGGIIQCLLRVKDKRKGSVCVHGHPQETEYKQEQSINGGISFEQKKSRSGMYGLRNDFVCLQFLASTESGCSFHGAHTRILFKGTPLVPRGNVEI